MYSLSFCSLNLLFSVPDIMIFRHASPTEILPFLNFSHWVAKHIIDKSPVQTTSAFDGCWLNEVTLSDFVPF